MDLMATLTDTFTVYQ